MPFEACESAMLGFHHERLYGKGAAVRPQRRSSPMRRARWRRSTWAARAAAQDRQFLRRQSAEDRAGARDRAQSRDPAGRQPTRGVDIGAIEFIHKRIVAQRDAGKALLLVSVELDEIFALSDRIVVLCAGRITGERRPEEPTRRTSAS